MYSIFYGIVKKEWVCGITIAESCKDQYLRIGCGKIPAPIMSSLGYLGVGWNFGD